MKIHRKIVNYTIINDFQVNLREKIFKYILTVRKFECQKTVIEPSNLFKS